MPLDSPSPSRPSPLQRAIQAASWWLMAQGALLLFMGPWLSNLLRLRYHDNMVPYLQLGGLALAILGLFVNRAVREASRQYLAVDTLTLFFLVLAALRLRYRVSGFSLTWFEWASFALDLGLGAALVLFRTKGSQMQAPGSLVAMDAALMARQALDAAKSLAGAEKPKAPAVAAPAPAAPATAEAAPEAAAAPGPEPAPAAAPRPKPASQAIPHMD